MATLCALIRVNSCNSWINVNISHLSRKFAKTEAPISLLPNSMFDTQLTQLKLLTIFITLFLFTATGVSAKINHVVIQKALAQIPKVVRASWWGFDEKDSTKALQAAINSGADKVIIENMGKQWIVGDTIQLASNQEIFFEKGAIVLAKKGRFKPKMACLFEARQKENITLTQARKHHILKPSGFQ